MNPQIESRELLSPRERIATPATAINIIKTYSRIA
jgi:hypothetical protein